MTQAAGLMRMVAAAAQLYNNHLLRGAQQTANMARRYVSDRTIFEPAVTTFKIGYSPPRSNGSPPWVLSRLGLDTDAALAAGLVVYDRSGDLVDPMAGRLVFPQANPQGRFVGFVGRLLGDSDRRDKYLATPRTEIFRRSEIVYRLDMAYRAIESQNTAVVVEGLLDAVLLWQVGIKHAVATGTVGMTDAQAQLIARHANNVEVMFDNDRHGREAFDRLRRYRGQFFGRVTWKDYPTKFADPAEFAVAAMHRAGIKGLTTAN